MKDNIGLGQTPSLLNWDEVASKVEYTGSRRNFKIINQTNDINNQIQLAQSQDSGVREDTVNGFEAGATEVRWDGIDPALFGLDGYNAVKLSSWDNGTGMDKKTLEEVTNFSASKGKRGGMHGHKGKGAKLSWMKVNPAGLVWISSFLDKLTGTYKVHRVVMDGDPKKEEWGVKQYRVENDDTTSTEVCIDITNDIDWDNVPSYITKDASWTLKIYCGHDKKQNTVKQPYEIGKNLKQGWLVRELSRRFPCINKDVKIKVGENSSYLTNDSVTDFKTIYQILQDYSKSSGGKLQYETITIKKDPNSWETEMPESLGEQFPFFTEDDELNITFVWDDFCEIKNNEEKCYSWYKSRMGITGTFSGIIYEPTQQNIPPMHWAELYDYSGPLSRIDDSGVTRGGNSWRQKALELGIRDGYKKFRIFVWIGREDRIVNNENRTELVDVNDPRVTKIGLKDYKSHIHQAMPEWIKKKIEDETIETQNLDSIRASLNDLLKRLRLKENAKKVEGGTPGRAEPSPATCPKCNAKMARSQKVCSSCGYVRPTSSGGGGSKSHQGSLVPDINGRAKVIKRFPEIIPLDEGEWKGLPLDETFKNVGAQYIMESNILYVNLTYPAFTNFKQELLVHKQEEQEWTDNTDVHSISKQIKDVVDTTIIHKCLGENFVYALVTLENKGFNNEKSFESLTNPAVLSMYCESWRDADKLKQAKKSVEKMALFTNTSNSSIVVGKLELGNKIDSVNKNSPGTVTAPNITEVK